MLRCWLRPTKPHTALTPSSAAASNTRSMKSCFFCRVGGVVMEQVVEVGEVRDADAGGRDGRLHARRARPVERLAQVQRVGHRIEHRLRRHVGLRRVQRRGQLDVVGAELARECQPVLDRAIRVGVAHLPRRQLLQRRGEHADLHELRSKRRDSHGTSVQTPPCPALSRMASTIRLAR